ncbi:hypothetical protein [Thermofilum sp.]|uniref:hypothetical protein n=1 Tax=Thermofilum sp. TaxID=1961369 RepID=UPI0031680235
MLKQLEDKYKRVVATVNPDVKKYVNAGRELRLSLYSTLLVTATVTTLYYMRILDFSDSLTTVLITALILAPWVKVIDTVSSVSSLRKKIEQELAFLLVASAAVSKTGLELAEMLKYVSSSRVFKGLRALGERFAQLSNLFGSSQAMHMLSRIASGKTRLLLTEYAASLSSGTALYLLRDRASDIVKSAAVDADRAVQSRVVFGLMLTIAFGIAPSLLVGMMMLQSISIEGSVVEPGPEAYIYSVAVASILPLVLVLIPGYPLSMSIVIDKKLSRILNALTLVGAVLLSAPAVILVTNGDIESFKDSVFNYALFSLVAGAPGFILVIEQLFSSRVDAVVEDMLNHVRVWRSLHLYKSSVLEKEAKRRVRPWIVDYLVEALGFFKQVGDCDPGVFELLVMYIHECKRSLRKYVQTLAVILAVVLISPAMNSSILSFGAKLFPQHIILGYISSIAYGFVASKIALGENKSTLLPALSALIYALTLPA